MNPVQHPTASPQTAPGKALSIERFFTTPDTHPFDAIEWERRDARIGHGDRVAFEQRDVEFPKSWSQNATNIVAQKYFRGQLGSPERESSVKEMVSRVAGTIARWGREGNYFATEEDQAAALAHARADISLDAAGVTPGQDESARSSVAVRDECMRAVEEAGGWRLAARATGEAGGARVSARELMAEIAEAAYSCAD